MQFGNLAEIRKGCDNFLSRRVSQSQEKVRYRDSLARLYVKTRRLSCRELSSNMQYDDAFTYIMFITLEHKFKSSEHKFKSTEHKFKSFE